MIGVRVVSKSDVGQATIQKVMGADNGRSDWRVFFKERIENDDPFSIVLEYRNRLARAAVPPAYLLEVIQKQLEELGAVQGLDYEVSTL